MTDTPLDKAVERAAQPTWQIVITAHGNPGQLSWSPNGHDQAVGLILVDQAKQLLERQYEARRKDRPAIVVPSVLPKGNDGS